MFVWLSQFLFPCLLCLFAIDSLSLSLSIPSFLFENDGAQYILASKGHYRGNVLCICLHQERGTSYSRSQLVDNGFQVTIQDQYEKQFPSIYFLNRHFNYQWEINADFNHYRWKNTYPSLLLKLCTKYRIKILYMS